MDGISALWGRRPLTAVLTGLALAGCATATPESAFQLKPEVLALRRLQTRRFNTDEKTLLKASSGVLQDLGFIIDEVNTEAGLISCSKKRDAKEPGQIILGIVALMFGIEPSWEVDQVIRVSVATNPVQPSAGNVPVGTTVRVTFQRIVTNLKHEVTRREGITDQAIYRVFFEKLSQSVFLEAQEI